MSAADEVRAAWDANAEHWDVLMGVDGNPFTHAVVWPATEQLLGPCAGERVLEVGCGTGLGARRLLAAGAEVVAFDLSARMIELARRRTPAADYRVLDASDEQALLALGTDAFDAAVATMALMDMEAIDPLFRALAQLLRPGGRFVFTVMHPAFNHNRAGFLIEELNGPDGPQSRR
jgi:SAM-dependent methyltransferase